MKLTTLLALTSISLLVGCAAVKSTASAIEELATGGKEVSEAHSLITAPSSKQSVLASDVKIFLKSPAEPFQEIGLIEARGKGFSGERRDSELALEALRKEAARIGANGVIVTNSWQEIDTVTPHGSSTHRKIKGTAIVY